MAKKRKRNIPPERREKYARTMRLLEERIAYHRAKLAEEQGRSAST